MRKGAYYYNGAFYTAADLSKLSGVSLQTTRSRLKHGWSVEDTVEIPEEEESGKLDECWKGKTLEIKFHQPIPAVFSHMQPTMEKVYVAVPSQNSTGVSGSCKPHFIITLDNGKPLVVYPGEFEIIGEAMVK